MPIDDASASAATMMTTFSTTGDSAGAMNARRECSAPIATATSPMKNKYGKSRRVSRIVSSSFPGVAANPGANNAVSGAARRTPAIVTIPSTTAIAVNTARAARFAAALPWAAR